MDEETFWFKAAEYRVLKGKKGIREAYDSMSTSYDCSQYLYWTRKMEEAEEKIIERWLRKFMAPVLDIGCGTGRYVIKIAKKGRDVVALEVSLKMLYKAIEKAKKCNILEKVNPILADGEYLPFRDDSFNGSICTLTFDHFEDCASVAREFSRVLKKNGLCILSTFNSHTLSDFKRRHNLPPDKIPFRTEGLPPVLIYEVGHSANEVVRLFGEYEFDTVDVKGCCYWHLLPANLTKYYRTELDRLLNAFKPLSKYAEIHVTMLRKR